jgi:nucleoside triphosphate pyrophosphatase
VDKRTPFPPDFRLVLASQSPRRHSLLKDIGVPFIVAPSDTDEVLEGDPVVALAEKNALSKVRGADLPRDLMPGAFVLGTDTLVAIDGRAMGKPGSAVEAARMLRALSGRDHQVVSGVALARVVGPSGTVGTAPIRGRGDPPIHPEILIEHAVTDVTFLPLDVDDIDAYVASEEWRGKAGAYAIQSLAGTFVSEVRGEYSNVVGLPLCLLSRMFRAAGFDLLRRTWL